MSRKKVVSAVPIAPPVIITPSLSPIALDVHASARYMSATVRQVRTLIATGELTAIRLGKKDVIRVSTIEEFLKKKEREAA